MTVDVAEQSRYTVTRHYRKALNAMKAARLSGSAEAMSLATSNLAYWTAQKKARSTAHG